MTTPTHLRLVSCLLATLNGALVVASAMLLLAAWTVSAGTNTVARVPFLRADKLAHRQPVTVLSIVNVASNETVITFSDGTTRREY